MFEYVDNTDFKVLSRFNPMVSFYNSRPRMVMFNTGPCVLTVDFLVALAVEWK